MVPEKAQVIKTENKAAPKKFAITDKDLAEDDDIDFTNFDFAQPSQKGSLRNFNISAGASLNQPVLTEKETNKPAVDWEKITLQKKKVASESKQDTRSKSDHITYE